MIVVSDTGPLNYLIRLGRVEVLPQLYGSVIIPETVRQEMLHPKAPEIVRMWAAQLPEWASLGQPTSLLPLTLDAGELAAVSLAVELKADLLLIDDSRGRQMAQMQSVQIVGTLGIITRAAQDGLLDLAETLTRLQQAGFYVAPQLIAGLLQSKSEE